MSRSSTSVCSDLRRFLQNYSIYALPLVFLIYLALESYQIDFRAFYLAGKAVLRGLDPYLNHVGPYPEFYAPVNAENSAFSGFRYPPIAAFVFSPLALLPYYVSKLIFTLLMWLILAAIAFQMVRRSGWRLQGEALLFVGISFPVLAVVERGQVDPLVVGLILASYWLAAKRERQAWAGFLIAFAGMIKIFPFVVLIEWSIRRQWRLVASAVLWSVVLFFAPYFFLGQQIYNHFWKRTFPEFFGAITSQSPINLHGQGVVFSKLVRAIEGNGLIVSHDFTNGFMNPLLRDSSIGAIVAGLLLTVLLLGAARNPSSELKFYAFLNLLNIFNPVAWIMGLVWYLPLFLYLYPVVSRMGRWLILLPLFLPPFLNVNAALAYGIGLLFCFAERSPLLFKNLMTKSALV